MYVNPPAPCPGSLPRSPLTVATSACHGEQQQYLHYSYKYYKHDHDDWLYYVYY